MKEKKGKNIRITGGKVLLQKKWFYIFKTQEDYINYYN